MERGWAAAQHQHHVWCALLGRGLRRGFCTGSVSWYANFGELHPGAVYTYLMKLPVLGQAIEDCFCHLTSLKVCLCWPPDERQVAFQVNPTVALQEMTVVDADETRLKIKVRQRVPRSPASICACR